MSSGPWQQSNTDDLCTCSPLTRFFQLVRTEVEDCWKRRDSSGLSTCWVHPQYVHINFGICWKLHIKTFFLPLCFLFVVFLEGVLCSGVHCECTCMIVRVIFTFTNELCKTIDSRHAYTGYGKTELRRDLRAVSPTKKGIFSVFYIAFLKTNITPP